MSTVTVERDLDIRSTWLHYGWVNVVIAAVAMGATYPGRSQGLGMFTQGILTDFGLLEQRGFYGSLILWATLLGALFCLPIGWLIDRVGSRFVLAAVYALFGGSVIWLSQAASWQELFGGADPHARLRPKRLSVVSITLVAKWFKGKSLAMAMAVYAVLMSLMFVALNEFVSYALQSLGWDWRHTTAVMGWTLLAALAPLSLIFTRSAPNGIGGPAGNAERDEPMARNDLPAELKTGVTAEVTQSHHVTNEPRAEAGPSAAQLPQSAEDGLEGATLSQALSTPAFWVFSLAVSFYGLISSGIFTFNQEIFKDNGLHPDVYRTSITLAFAIGLPSKFLAAWLSDRIGIHRVLAISMAIQTLALLALPMVHTEAEAYAYAFAMAVCGGVIARGVFRRLGASVRPARGGAHPGDRADADGAGVGNRAAAVRHLPRSHRIVRAHPRCAGANRAGVEPGELVHPIGKARHASITTWPSSTATL